MEVVEVPANITQAELDDLVNTRYRQVDGGEFTSDPEYWERGTCEAVLTDMPNAVPSMMAFRTAHGLHIERADAAAQTVESSGPTEACDEMSKLSGLVQGPSGEFVPAGDQQNAAMPRTGPDLTGVDAYALQRELERRGLLVQLWSPEDFEFIGHEDE